MERALFGVLRARRDCGDKKTGTPCIHLPDAAIREALIKSRMRDRGDLGRGQVGEDAV
jgi:hypothetical protein